MGLKSIIISAIGCLLSSNTADASKIRVVHPSDLRDEFQQIVDGDFEKGVLKSSMANFGFFNYGTKL